ncbi:CHASE2 domain-containing protein [Leptolyngbya boryana CZ1]|uniref:CHASE2 domain-containing protein n=1 Tax=Leptolyngbya boryana CZ1 TaxID=3060204 RepID=A0AA96WTN9_LEPBY|nr:CHASE2 domain-containing protein [Leptolyngbya boryana]WNZ44084.1 CHASE2 domain-containing protein [Leptolyngbya boryana CZ1]
MKIFLEVTFVKQVCLFKLFGQGWEQSPVEIPYSEALTEYYDLWHKAYLAHYQSVGSEIRGSVKIGTGKTPSRDWRSELVQAEAILLTEFNGWLEHERLNKIRDTISRCAIEVQTNSKETSRFVDLFVTCHSQDSLLDLAHLPWEAWEVGREFAKLIDGQTIRIARKPNTIQSGVVKRPYRDRLRVLAIFGDETDLNFKAEKAELKKFPGYVDLDDPRFKGTTDLKQKICDAIADPQGWDILFFAGHSNEAKLVQGEIAIAPGKSLMIREIEPQLKLAQERGLQFAIFNSCKGLDIANALIELGLSQVAIMREPIHDAVAIQFLNGFLRALTNYDDVHSALMFACGQFRASRTKYPSAYLIPSLFRHPEAELFRLPQSRYQFRKLLPKRNQAIALATLAFLSLLPPVQQALMQSRQVLQTGYRSLRQSVSTQKPSVLLVQIDQTSVEQLDARKVYPMDRSYLAQLLKRAQTIKPTTIAIDYVFDNPEAEDQALKREIQQAIQQRTKVILANTEDPKTITPSVAPLDQIQQGYINAFPFYVELPSQPCHQFCPFSLAIAKTQSSKLDQAQLLPLTTFSQAFGQNWLQPIIDFSISPDEAYQTISATDFLQQSSTDLPKIVLIAPGNYDRAGMTGRGEDLFDPPPLSIALWRSSSTFTGGEFHAYMVHHLLQRRLVIPIPDLWLIAIAAVLGQVIVLRLQDSQYSQRRMLGILIGGTILWGWLGLELYLSASILVPGLLPAIVFWLYAFPLVKQMGQKA